jgi:hypothetical protein
VEYTVVQRTHFCSCCLDSNQVTRMDANICSAVPQHDIKVKSMSYKMFSVSELYSYLSYRFEPRKLRREKVTVTKMAV